MAQQTAVEYLFMMLANHNILNHKVLADNKHLTELTYRIKTEAKQMEKEQIMKSFKSARIPYKYDADLRLNGFEDAENYYNETFGNK